MAVTNTGVVLRTITGVHDANFVRPLGDELIIDGSLDNPSNWNGTGTWSISDGKASSSGNSVTQYFAQDINLTIGVSYMISYDVILNTLSANKLLMSGTSAFTSTEIPSSIGRNTVILEVTGIASSGYSFRMANSANNASGSITIDNISVKEILVNRESTTTNTGIVERSVVGVHDANFVHPLGDEEILNGGFDTASGWLNGGDSTIVGGLAHFESNTNLYSYIKQDISSLTTKTYKIQLEVKNYVSGAVQVLFRGSSNALQVLNVSSDGVYTAYLTPNANGDIFEVSRHYIGGNFNFTIDNISVKEVLVNRESTATNTGIVERSLTGVNESVAFRQDVRTNLVPYSEDFSNAYWNKSNASVTNAVSSPDGGLNAFKLVESVGNTSHNVYSGNIAVTLGSEYTVSLYVKKAERSIIKIDGGFRLTLGATFNLETLQVTGLGTIEALTNGWYKLTASGIGEVSNGATNIFVFLLNDNGTQAYQGDGTSGIYIYGAQLEEASQATSYIPTNGAAVTVDNNSTSVVNNTGIVERPITGVNESDPMFPDNTISNIVNIAGLVSSLIADLKARATTFENEEATQEILINLQKC